MDRDTWGADGDTQLLQHLLGAPERFRGPGETFPDEARGKMKTLPPNQTNHEPPGRRHRASSESEPAPHFQLLLGPGQRGLGAPVPGAPGLTRFGGILGLLPQGQIGPDLRQEPLSSGPAWGHALCEHQSGFILTAGETQAETLPPTPKMWALESVGLGCESCPTPPLCSSGQAANSL